MQLLSVLAIFLVVVLQSTFAISLEKVLEPTLSNQDVKVGWKPPFIGNGKRSVVEPSHDIKAKDYHVDQPSHDIKAKGYHVDQPSHDIKAKDYFWPTKRSVAEAFAQDVKAKDV